MTSGVHQAQDMYVIARLSALMEDLEIQEKEVQDVGPPEPVLLRPDLQNLLNPDPVPSRLEDVHKLHAIIRGSDKKIDIPSVLRLRRMHDRNSGVLTEKACELKSRYKNYAPSHLCAAVESLNEASNMPQTSAYGAETSDV